MNKNQAMKQPHRFFELTEAPIWRTEIGAILQPTPDADLPFICIVPKGCLSVGSKVHITGNFRPLNQKDQKRIEDAQT